MPRFSLAAVLTVLAVGVLAAAALAGAYEEVYDDFDLDGRLTPCYFSVAALEEALAEIPTDTDQYNPDFRDEVTAERNLVRAGRCGTADGAAARLRIAGLRARGVSPRREWVSVTNAGDAKVRLRGWSVSNRRKRFYTFARGALAPGRTLRLRSGRGTDGRGKIHWGSRAELWPDAGGEAKLWAPGRRLVQKLRYGSFR